MNKRDMYSKNDSEWLEGENFCNDIEIWFCIMIDVSHVCRWKFFFFFFGKCQSKKFKSLGYTSISKCKSQFVLNFDSKESWCGC